MTPRFTEYIYDDNGGGGRSVDDGGKRSSDVSIRSKSSEERGMTLANAVRHSVSRVTEYINTEYALFTRAESLQESFGTILLPLACLPSS